MIDVTPAAMRKIKDFIETNRIESGIRVTLMEGGCSGAALGIVLDEATDDDVAINLEGITFLVHRELLQESGNIKIDFVETCGADCACSSGGFKISSERPVTPAGACSCG